MTRMMLAHASSGIPQRGFGLSIDCSAITQDHFINYVAALDATEHPDAAIPAIAQIDTHVTVHIPAAPSTTLACGSERDLSGRGKTPVHIPSPFQCICPAQGILAHS